METMTDGGQSRLVRVGLQRDVNLYRHIRSYIVPLTISWLAYRVIITSQTSSPSLLQWVMEQFKSFTHVQRFIVEVGPLLPLRLRSIPLHIYLFTTDLFPHCRRTWWALSSSLRAYPL